MAKSGAQEFIEQLIEDIDLQRLHRWQLEQLIDASYAELKRREAMSVDPAARGILRQEKKRRDREAGRWK